MSEQQAPPQPPLVGGQAVADPTAAMNAILNAAQDAATKAKGAQDARDTKDYAQAVLWLAQSVVVLDPNRMAGGESPEARLAAAPPQPPVAPTPRKAPSSDANKDGRIGS